MRSPVQSWVPLQESTAETLCFFRLYTLKPRPIGADIDGSDLRSLLSRALMAMAPVSVANDGLRVPHTNPKNQFFSLSLITLSANYQEILVSSIETNQGYISQKGT